MHTRRMLGYALVALGLAGCAALAGFEDEYTVGEVGTGTAGTATGTAGTSTGTAGTTTGTADTPTGTATATGTAGVGGGSPTGNTGGTGIGGGPQGGNGQGGTEPTWQEIDSFDVPINGSTVHSAATLTAGTTYRLRASGHFDCMNLGVECDAEYVDRSGEPDDMGTASFDFGIGIDTTTPGLAVPPDWGDHNAAHEYEVDWMGDDRQISARIFDPNYSNNSGNPLRIQIFEFK